MVQAAAVAAALAGREPFPAAVAAASTAAMRCGLEELAVVAARDLDPRELGGDGWRVESFAAESVPVAVVVGGGAGSFEEAVTLAVRCGGDTDTVGAMAGAIAGARFGASNIPRRWRSSLEDGEHGRAHVERLAIALVAASVDSR